MKILGNNEMSLTLTKDLKSQNWTKHIDVMYYHMCGLVEDGELAIELIEISAILTDRLIKTLFVGLFKKYQDK